MLIPLEGARPQPRGALLAARGSLCPTCGTSEKGYGLSGDADCCSAAGLHSPSGHLAAQEAYREREGLPILKLGSGESIEGG